MKQYSICPSVTIISFHKNANAHGVFSRSTRGNGHLLCLRGKLTPRNSAIRSTRQPCVAIRIVLKTASPYWCSYFSSIVEFARIDVGTWAREYCIAFHWDLENSLSYLWILEQMDTLSLLSIGTFSFSRIQWRPVGEQLALVQSVEGGFQSSFINSGFVSNQILHLKC